MAELDIKKGDSLIIGSNSYPILETEWWDFPNALDASFIKQATVSCSTKRQTFTNSKRETSTDASANLSNLKCLPLDVISSDLALRTGLQAPHTTRHTQIANDSGYMVIIIEFLEAIH